MNKDKKKFLNLYGGMRTENQLSPEVGTSQEGLAVGGRMNSEE